MKTLTLIAILDDRPFTVQGLCLIVDGTHSILFAGVTVAQNGTDFDRNANDFVFRAH